MTSTSTTSAHRVIVVGAGHAAANLVGLLRSGGHDGEILMIGDEPLHPYHRPPLSKQFAADGPLEEWLRHPDFYPEQRIEVALQRRVTAIDRAARQVTTDAGERYDYDALVLATGARPRTLPAPGSDLDGVIGLRTMADAHTLRTWLTEGRRFVIIGAGYIGLEVAAVLRSCELPVTVVERESRVLARVASEEFSTIIADHHASAGTQILTDTQVVELLGDANGHVRALVTADGSELPCDAVLVGIGAVPNDELARDAGVECVPAGGVVVDEHGQTSDPAILAMGDVTVRTVPGVDGLRRLESIPSATEQARQVAATILTGHPPAPEAPWFWSDQFDLKLKIAGIVRPGPQITLRGVPESGRFALYHHVDGVITAVESSNAPQEFMAGRKWVGHRTRIDPARLADQSVALRDAVA